MLTVRRAEPTDAPEVVRVANAGWRHTYKGLIPDAAIDEVLKNWYSEERIRRTITSSTMKVAEKDGRVVGYLVHAPISESTEEVYSFYVDPAELGKGMGWALWQNMTAEARASGRSHVELWVLEGNRLGISWYERHAGAVVGRQQIDLPDGPHSELRYRFDLP